MIAGLGWGWQCLLILLFLYYPALSSSQWRLASAILFLASASFAHVGSWDVSFHLFSALSYQGSIRGSARSPTLKAFLRAIVLALYEMTVLLFILIEITIASSSLHY
ncbi:hypothetical protein MUK42_14491 [Musa troglodytarum]|uniref:Uncharacterized protein n=1 Tax=Musa troglodytarum TaxID=320322 RepID=A0A9E7HMK4_9LILI|nr:hypothetical protein MUK42_14491 [Musa troglodytarum]